MIPFDLEKAKRGDSVCLEDKTLVKILDFDLNDEILGHSVMFKTKLFDGFESYNIANQKGEMKIYDHEGNSSMKQVLFMASKYAYMNIYIDPLKKTAYGSILYRTDEERSSHINDGGEVFFMRCKSRTLRISGNRRDKDNRRSIL